MNTLRKGKNTELRFSVQEYRGRRYADIRLWYRGAKTDGDWRPTGKGVTFGLDQAQEFLASTKQLVSEAEEAYAEENAAATALMAS